MTKCKDVSYPAGTRGVKSHGACSRSRPPQYSPRVFAAAAYPTCPGWDMGRYSSAAAAAAAAAAAGGGGGVGGGGDGTSPG